MSPLPRPAKSSLPDAESVALSSSSRAARAPISPALDRSGRSPLAAAPRSPRHVALPPPRVPGPNAHVSIAPHSAPRTATRPRLVRPAIDVSWSANYDEWMIDIMRRRALRLNSGARRRGVHGSVRAVELAVILERFRDDHGRWLCALCHASVTLDDLSFDHVVALADGGEHEAANLVPAHRKCNEIKGSEKAQHRASAVDRWLSEWAGSHQGATPRAAARHAVHLAATVPVPAR